MNDLLIRMTPCDVRDVNWRGERLAHAWSSAQQPDAFAAIFGGLDKVLDSGDLADELARHDDFCELAAQVAVIRKLQRELGNRDAADADHAVLNEIRRSSNPWLHREAGNLLAQIADDRGQVAAHDGAEELAPGLDSGSNLVGLECWVWWHGGDSVTLPPRVGVVSLYRQRLWYTATDSDGQEFTGNHAQPFSMGKPEIPV